MATWFRDCGQAALAVASDLCTKQTDQFVVRFLKQTNLCQALLPKALRLQCPDLAHDVVVKSYKDALQVMQSLLSRACGFLKGGLPFEEAVVELSEDRSGLGHRGCAL